MTHPVSEVWRLAERPRHRDRRGTGDPGPVVGRRVPASIDAEALTDASRSTDAAGAAKELRVRIALAAAREVALAASLMDQDAQRRDAARRDALLELQARKKELEEVRVASNVALAALCSRLGLRIERGALVEDDPATLEELSGKLGVSCPDANPGWWTRFGHRILSGAVAGPLLGFGLGMLSGKLELNDLGAEAGSLVLWAALGAGIALSVSESLHSLGMGLGEALTRSSQSDPRRSAALKARVCGIALASLAALFALIESSVERIGILRSLSAGESLGAFRVGSVELLAVSLVVALPSVVCCAVAGVFEGERRANLAILRSALAKDRRSAHRSPVRALAAASLGCLDSIEAALAQVEERVQQLESRPEGLSESERLKLEDLHADALLAAYRAEDSLWGAEPESRQIRARPRGQKRSLTAWLGAILRLPPGGG